MCNVDSMWRAIESCGAKGDVTNTPADLACADKIVLPGVGAFPDAMAFLNESGLADAIREQVTQHDVPLLGVCLGMQLLATRGFEGTETQGLNLIEAEVVRLFSSTSPIPHVGWNEAAPVDNCRLFAGIAHQADFYFVHSFHMQCVDTANVVATTPYCDGFASAVVNGNVVGTQFHPEKSQASGLRLLRNFLDW